MSSTTQPTRTGGDAYYTPPAVARACVATLAMPPGARCWEPHAGSGSFVEALREGGASEVITTDTDPVSWYASEDAATAQCDAAIIAGNPPYNEAEMHLRNLLPQARIAAGFLLRLAFWEAQVRQDFWRAHPPAEVHVLVRRPSFLERYEATDPGGLAGAEMSRGGFHVGPLRRREGGALVLDHHGLPRRARTDSVAYAFFVWRTAHQGPPTLHHLHWRTP